MHDYTLLRQYCNLNQFSKVDTLALLARAIIENCPNDIVNFSPTGDWVHLDELIPDEQAAIKNACLNVFVSKMQDLGLLATEECILENIQRCRDKILPARVNKSIQSARRMIAEGEALLRTEEAELERCISAIYQSHVSLEKVRKEKKSKEIHEAVRLLQEMRQKCDEMEKDLRAKGALPK